MYYSCERCGKIKESPYPSQAKTYCSHRCANISLWEHRSGAELIGLKCETCGEEFAVLACDHRFKVGTVKYCSLRCSAEGHKTGGLKMCPVCGKIFYTTRAKVCSKECSKEWASATKTTGKPYFENGYLVIHKRGYNKKGNAKLHRLIAEEHLGRKLKQNEVVHHINGVKTDNRIENLSVMGWGEHSALHRSLERKKKLMLAVHGIRVKEV